MFIRNTFQALTLMLYQQNNVCTNNLRIRIKTMLFSNVNYNRKPQTVQTIHTTSRTEKEDRKSMMASVPKRDEGVQGEKSIDIDSSKIRKNIFPDINTADTFFDGVRFAEIPIVHIRVSKNNTIMQLTDYKGKPVVMRSCGMEGFKNTRKGTNVAAQATGISLSMRALENGFKKVRVCVRGLGPGRMASVKGLQMGGLEIISVTDTTPTPYPGSGNRPRKARRL